MPGPSMYGVGEGPPELWGRNYLTTVALLNKGLSTALRELGPVMLQRRGGGNVEFSAAPDVERVIDGLMALTADQMAYLHVPAEEVLADDPAHHTVRARLALLDQGHQGFLRPIDKLRTPELPGTQRAAWLEALAAQVDRHAANDKATYGDLPAAVFGHSARSRTRADAGSWVQLVALTVSVGVDPPPVSAEHRPLVRQELDRLNERRSNLRLPLRRTIARELSPPKPAPRPRLAVPLSSRPDRFTRAIDAITAVVDGTGPKAR